MLGFLHLQSRLGHPSVEAFTDAELRLVHAVAEEIALSLTNVGLREILRHQAFRDPLTGLYNRRFFQEALDLELRRAARTRLPVGLVMLDVDGFKKINDACGHAAGDSVSSGAWQPCYSRKSEQATSSADMAAMSFPS